MRRLLAVVLIIAGLGLLAYPKARGYYFDYRRQQLLNAWNEQIAPARPLESPEEPPAAEDNRFDSALQKYILDNMIGVLRIPGINLELPVLKKDSAADLDISIAQVAGSAPPGAAGNFIVAGHRQLEYGRHFNRLHEVKKGDLIEFDGPEETFVYWVFEARVIQPEETGVLEQSEEKLITLITCHGSRRPFSRLIVKGRLEEVTGF